MMFFCSPFFRNDRKRRRESSPTQNPSKRRIPTDGNKSVFSRLSGPVRNNNNNNNNSKDEEHKLAIKPRIQSRVIRELPTRQEVVAAQGDDEQSRARNRRMFGSLLGTLQKFTQEEAKLKSKVDKKAQIEKKLEEQEKKERINMKKERETLFINRKKQQLEIKKLELKMELMKEFEVWENSKKDLKHFIKTKSRPHIFYQPKTANDKVEKQLTKSRAAIEEEIEKRRKKLNDEIQQIENTFKQKEDDLLKNNHGKNLEDDVDMDGDVEIEEENTKIDLSLYVENHLAGEEDQNGSLNHSKLPKIRVKIENDIVTGESKLKSVISGATIVEGLFCMLFPVDFHFLIIQIISDPQTLSSKIMKQDDSPGFIRSASMERNLTSIVIVTQNDYKDSNPSKDHSD